MALGKNRTRMNVKGGGKLMLRQIYPVPVDAFSDAGYLGGTDLADEHNMIELQDEAGNMVNAESGARKSTIQTVLKQSGIDEINLVKDAANKYYDLYYCARLSNGSYQELSAAVCKIKPGPTLKFASATERTIAVTIYLLAPKASAVRTPTGFNVTENEPYVLAENATALGAPTESAATLTALISTVL